LGGSSKRLLNEYPLPVFVTFEGPEGAGKSTVLKRVAESLEAEGRTVLCTREPGAGSVGKAIRDILLHGEALDPKCELFLFLADRSQHVSAIIRPALERGEIVLCDRHADSTVVYQGVGRGIGPDVTKPLNKLATGGLVPDLTLLLDISPEAGLARVTDANRLDKEPLEFHQKVRQGFLDLARSEPHRIVIVNAEMPVDHVVQHCLAAIRDREGSNRP
jgi:dTMP kinase